MYDIEVAAKEFEGKPLVQQHMRINDLLKDEIKQMHGLRIKTKPLSKQ
jgi:stress-induced morphogen